MTVCLPLDDPNTSWKQYCPSAFAAILFFVLFGATLGLHIFQAVKLQKKFCWVVIMGAAWEFATYVFRYSSVEHPTTKTWYEGSTLLVLLAPLWINAFEYMLLGRMIYFFLPNQQMFRIQAKRIGLYFVIGDIFSFITQLFGGVMIIKSTNPTGLRIYTAGCVIQAVVVLIYLFLVFTFHKRVSREADPSAAQEAKRMVVIMYISTIIIMIRIIFRIVEFSAGAGGSLTATIEGHEAYVYVLDALPLFLALALLNIVHPGTILIGPASEFKKIRDQTQW
ncbi:RTA1 like protein-domain-containing protein [Xylogone sp. PMI_703]|nr:RTA1 like protein-domain-containing protein [Xylogone sp. PMI_703]